MPSVKFNSFVMCVGHWRQFKLVKFERWQYGRVDKNHDFFGKKSDFLKFKSNFFNLNQIKIYIRAFHFLLGYCTYNYHNYVNNLAAHHLLQE